MAHTERLNLMNANTQRNLNLSTTIKHNGSSVQFTFRSNHLFYDPNCGVVSVVVDNDGKANMVDIPPSDRSSTKQLGEWNDRLRLLCQELYDGKVTGNGERIRYVSNELILADGHKLTVFGRPMYDINDVLDFVRGVVVNWLDPSGAYPPSRRDIDDITIAANWPTESCKACHHPCLLRNSYYH